jgi:hypothetical protein
VFGPDVRDGGLHSIVLSAGGRANGESVGE